MCCTIFDKDDAGRRMWNTAAGCGSAPHALEGLDILTGEEGWVDGGRLILCHGMVLYFVSKIPPHG